MKSPFLTLIALVIVLAPAVPAAAGVGTASKLGCHPPQASVIKRSQYARVFRLGGRSYGCLVSTNQAYRLGDKSENESYPDSLKLGLVVRLAGRYLAYELRFSGREDPDFNLQVLDLRTGKVRRAPETRAEYGVAAKRPDGGITDIVLTAHGSVGWIIRDIFGDTVPLEVHKADRSTTGRLLDSSPTIDPGSLRLAGETLSWTIAGVARSTSLR